MKNDIKKIIFLHYQTIVILSYSVPFLLIFVMGIGRYRVVLSFSMFFLVKAALSYFKKENRLLYLLFLPVLLSMLYLDIKNGQIYPIFPRLNFIVTISIVIAIEVLMRGYINNILERLSDKVLFKVCPSCKYDNKNLVEQCNNCSYSKNNDGNLIEIEQSNNMPIVTLDINNEIENYNKVGLYRKPSKKIVDILNLSVGESVLINLKIFPFRTFFKDGNRDIANNLILTSQGIYFLDYSFFGSGWRMRKVISYGQIINVSFTSKKVFASEKPIFSINTANGLYEVLFSTFSPYREKIERIIDCIKKRNPKISVEIDFPKML